MLEASKSVPSNRPASFYSQNGEATIRLIEEPLAKRLSSASASDTSEKVPSVLNVLVEYCLLEIILLHMFLLLW